MKPQIKFNHGAESLTEAFGITLTAEQLSDKITNCVEQWMESEDSTKNSNLGEFIHNHIDYEIILFIATNDLLHQVSKTVQDNPIEKLLKILSKISRDESKNDSINQLLKDIESGKFKDN